MRIVLGRGPQPCRFMIVGEAPGKTEAQTGVPFSGPSGKKLEQYLEYSGLPPLRSCFITNVVKQFQEGNPDPDHQQILDWTPTLLSEIEETKPQIILAVGRYAARWFLGESCPDMETIHGMPHYSPARLPECACDSIIIPCFHTAGALWNYERGSLIRYGYELAGYWASRLDRGLPVHYRYDQFKDGEDYRDVTGEELESILNSPHCSRSIVGLDTEGTPERPWSIQLSLDPGSGLLLRCSQPDFQLGIQSIARYLNRNRPTIALHDASTPKCSCYDVVMCRTMGLELQGFKWFNTMYWAYLRRLEPQGNKPLCDRWQAMEMEDYESTIGLISKDQQVEYLTRALDFALSLGKPDKRYIKENDGTTRVTQPKAIRTTIESIIQDVAEGKETKDGPTDPMTRWEDLRDSNPQQGVEVETRLGLMPEATLDNVPLDKATHYSCSDSDGTLRNALTFMDMLQ